MAYRIEGKDIVFGGFQNGIAESPYAGIADMRNVDTVSVPGEASVSFSEVAVTAPPAVTNEAFSAVGFQDIELVSVSSETNDTDDSTTLTWSHTIADGLNKALVVAVCNGLPDNGSTITAATYDGQALTFVNTATVTSPGRSQSTSYYIMIDPPVGTADIEFTRTVPMGFEGSWCGAAADFTGVKPSSNPNTSNATPTTASATSLSSSFTTTVDNCVAVLASSVAAGEGQTAGSGLTEIIDQTGEDVSIALYRSTSPISPAGLFNMQTSSATSTSRTHNSVALRPVAGVGTENVIVWSGTPSGLYTGCAIIFNTLNVVEGDANIQTGVVYYVKVITATTFELYTMPLCTGDPIAITADVSGTFTVYQYGNQRAIGSISPVARYVNSFSIFASGPNGVYLTDASNYAWVILSAANGVLLPNYLYFLGNIGGIGAGNISSSGINIWNGYLLLFGPSAGTSSNVNSDAAAINDLFSNGPAATWQYAWQTFSTLGGVNGRIDTLYSAEDGNLYMTTTSGLGSLIETPGDVFDPSDGNSYSATASAILLPDNDRSTCIAELGGILLIGGRGGYVYTWDKISPSFSSLLNIPDPFISNIIATNQNAYVFSGVRGRIYISNGSGIELYKKIPDYLTGVVNPYITWYDASYQRNQLYFSFRATDNADTALTTIGGAWAIDLGTGGLRMINKTTNSGYTALVTMVVEQPRVAGTGASTAPIFNDNVAGSGVMIGWFNNTTYGIDAPQTAPYTNYESYIEFDMAPVGTFLDPFSPSQIEWKTSKPLVTGEGVRISYRKNLTDAFTVIGESTTAGALSDLYRATFQKVQWLQLKAEIKSTATTPTYTRLTEVRIRDYPSGKNA